jgi:hypothetical protein
MAALAHLGEQIANLLESCLVARRPDRENAEILSEKDLKELRHNLAHLSITAVRGGITFRPSQAPRVRAATARRPVHDPLYVTGLRYGCTLASVCAPATV